MNVYKFISRLIVGIVLIFMAIWSIYTVLRTVAFPQLPIKKGSDFVVDMSGSMKDPDKTYARNAITEASRKNKIVIVLDYELTTFDITDSYIEKTVGNVANSIYRNQPYVVYTYFKDTGTLKITTNIDDTATDVVDKNKEGIDTDAKVVKEILYYQQNLKPTLGLKNWNFNLNTTATRNVALLSIGSIILLILGFGVLPTDAGYKFHLRRKREASHS